MSDDEYAFRCVSCGADYLTNFRSTPTNCYECGALHPWEETSEWPGRLFVPLKSEHWFAFQSYEKDIELRGINNQFNAETVQIGRHAELRRGYSTDDQLWGKIREVWVFDDIESIPQALDHERILPGSTEAAFIENATDLLGDYDQFIPFHVEVYNGV